MTLSLSEIPLYLSGWGDSNAEAVVDAVLVAHGFTESNSGEKIRIKRARGIDPNEKLCGNTYKYVLQGKYWYRQLD